MVHIPILHYHQHKKKSTTTKKAFKCDETKTKGSEHTLIM